MGPLAKRLAKAVDPADVAMIRERLVRGFYGTRRAKSRYPANGSRTSRNANFRKSPSRV